MSSVQSPGSGEERTQHPYVTDRVRLPTWNKGFKLSAQKPARGPDGGQQCHAGGERTPMHSTPGLGSARRVALGAAAEGGGREASMGPMGSTQRALDARLEAALLPGSAAAATPVVAASVSGDGAGGSLGSLADAFEAMALKAPATAAATPIPGAMRTPAAVAPAVGSSAAARGAAGAPVTPTPGTRRTGAMAGAMRTPGNAVPAAAGAAAARGAAGAPVTPMQPQHQQRPPRQPGMHQRQPGTQPRQPATQQRQAGRPRVSFGGTKVAQFDAGAAGAGADRSPAATPFSSHAAGHTPFSGAGARRVAGAPAQVSGGVPSHGGGLNLAASMEGALSRADEHGVAGCHTPVVQRGARVGGAEAGGFGGFGMVGREPQSTPKLLRRREQEEGEEKEEEYGLEEQEGQHGMQCSTPGTATHQPKQHLLKPERVPTGVKPVAASEVKQLLRDGCVPGPQEAASLGSCQVLSPVRSTRKVSGLLGGGEQVLTPVRRSVRKAGGAVQPAVEPLLESTHWCYAPNEALQQPQQGGAGVSDKGAGKAAGSNAAGSGGKGELARGTPDSKGGKQRENVARKLM